MRKTVTFLAATLVTGLVPVSTASALPVLPGFTGSCVISGTVIPFTDFQGTGRCTGLFYGETVVNTPVTATATADGLSVDPLPALQTGQGTLTFTDFAASPISFTFSQVGTSLVITGNRDGGAVGEVVPTSVTGSTRTAQVVATTEKRLY